MVEIPSNVLLAEQFAEVFDGFSIGSNDLTQLILGVDRLLDMTRTMVNVCADVVTTTVVDRHTRLEDTGNAPA